MTRLGDYIELFGAGVVAGVAVAILCAPLSVLVALKRLAFMGQGISHSAFGGLGIAMLLGLGSTAAFGLIAGFCVLTALAIAWTADRRAANADTVIGVFLVASMALGAILMTHRVRSGGQGLGWEELLFGSLLTVGRVDAVIAWVVGGVILAALAWFRRPLMFWAFDETAAEAFGAPTQRMRTLLMIMLAVATVLAMKLAGVVLATALLVMPGATALRMSSRLTVVLGLSLIVSILGVLGGLFGAFWFDLPPGACIVAVLTAAFFATWPLGGALERGRRSVREAKTRGASS